MKVIDPSITRAVAKDIIARNERQPSIERAIG